MIEVYSPQEIEDLFEAPEIGGHQKYDWDNMTLGMSFFIKCADYSEGYRGPQVPVKYKQMGYKVKTEKRQAKDGSGEYMIITRIEWYC